MDSLKKRRINISDRRKKQIVQNWLSSFVVTSVVVVAAVFVAPKEVSASFLSLETIGTDVRYSVEIIDEESTYADTLKIVAESAIDKRQQTLLSGTTEGFFYELLPNTEYTISVVGSSGFGEHALTKETVKTTSNYQGLIVNAEFSDGEYNETLNCSVEVAYSDYKSEISEVYLKYRYMIIGEEFYEPYVMEFYSTLVDSKHFTYNIEYLPRHTGYLELELEAVLVSEEVVVLDSKTFYSPVITQEPIVITQASVNYLSLEIVGTHINYSLEVEDLDSTLDYGSLKIVASNEFETFEQSLILGVNEGVFTSLSPSTEYTISIVGEINELPITLLYQFAETQVDYAGYFITADLYQGGYEQSFNCNIELEYFDYKSEFLAVYLKYYYFIDEGQNQPPEIEYTYEQVDSVNFTYLIEYLPLIPGYLEIQIEAVLSNEETIILDQMTIYSPTIVNAYSYVENATEDTVMVYVEGDSNLTGATYYAKIKLNGALIEEKEIIMNAFEGDGMWFYYGTVEFYGLLVETEYEIELYAQFTDPITLATETVLFNTLYAFTYSYMEPA